MSAPHYKSVSTSDALTYGRFSVVCPECGAPRAAYCAGSYIEHIEPLSHSVRLTAWLLENKPEDVAPLVQEMFRAAYPKAK